MFSSKPHLQAPQRRICSVVPVNEPVMRGARAAFHRGSAPSMSTGGASTVLFGSSFPGWDSTDGAAATSSAQTASSPNASPGAEVA